MEVAGIADWFIDAIFENIGKLFNAVLDWVISMFADVIIWMLDLVLNVAGPPLGTSDFGEALDTAVQMGRFVLPVFALAAIIQHLRHGDGTKVAATLLIDVPMAFLSMVLLHPVMVEASAFADAITSWALTLAPLEEGLKDVLTLNGIPNPTIGPILLFGELLAFVGGAVTMIAMMMRAAAIGMAILIGPLVIATRVFPAAARLAGTWITATTALIFIKPMVAFMWAVGWIMVADPLAGGEGNLAKMVMNFITGCAVIGLGGLVPWAIFKFLPEASNTVTTNLRTGLGQTAVTAVGTTVAVAGAAKMGMLRVPSARMQPPTPPDSGGGGSSLPQSPSGGGGGGSSPPSDSGPGPMLRSPIGAYPRSAPQAAP